MISSGNFSPSFAKKHWTVNSCFLFFTGVPPFPCSKEYAVTGSGLPALIFDKTRAVWNSAGLYVYTKIKGISNGGRQSRSIGLFRASPHSHGGASYAVTHSRRKYHHPPACLLARSLAWGYVTALVSVAPFPIAEISWRTRRPAPHAGNVFDGPIQFSLDSSSSVPLLLPGKILKLKFFTYIRQRFSKQILFPLFS